MRFEGITCTLRLERPRAHAVVLALSGIDAGELGRAPFVALETDLANGPIDLFIDTRDARAASASVERVSSVTMLTVDEVAPMSSKMRVVSDPVAFDEALARAKRGSYF